MPYIIAIIILIIIFIYNKFIFFAILGVAIAIAVFTLKNDTSKNADNLSTIKNAADSSRKTFKQKNKDINVSKYYQKFDDDTYDNTLGLDLFRHLFMDITPTNWESDLKKLLDNSSDDRGDKNSYHNYHLSVDAAFRYFFTQLKPHEKNICLKIDCTQNYCFSGKYRILELIIKKENILQTNLYEHFPMIKKTKISEMLSDLENAGFIEKTKRGNTNILNPRISFINERGRMYTYTTEFINNDYSVKEYY